MDSGKKEHADIMKENYRPSEETGRQTGYVDKILKAWEESQRQVAKAHEAYQLCLRRTYLKAGQVCEASFGFG